MTNLLARQILRPCTQELRQFVIFSLQLNFSQPCLFCWPTSGLFVMSSRWRDWILPAEPGAQNIVSFFIWHQQGRVASKISLLTTHVHIPHVTSLKTNLHGKTRNTISNVIWSNLYFIFFVSFTQKRCFIPSCGSHTLRRPTSLGMQLDLQLSPNIFYFYCHTVGDTNASCASKRCEVHQWNSGDFSSPFRQKSGGWWHT